MAVEKEAAAILSANVRKSGSYSVSRNFRPVKASGLGYVCPVGLLLSGRVSCYPFVME